MNADACPVCPPPFDREGCPALSVHATSAGVLSSHACPACGSAWLLLSADGWPAARRLDPIEAAQGEANRIALALALEGTWGGEHHAAA